MAQRSMFFDAQNGDRQYDAASFAALLQALTQRDGVVYGYGNALAVTAPGGMNVSVGTGAAFVLGRMFEVYGNAETLPIDPADPANPRIDRVVIRLDLSTGVRSVSLAVKTGVAQASPVAPALTRDVSTWELSLAQVYVDAGVAAIDAGNITDERGQAELCGYTRFAATDAKFDPTTGHKHTGADGDGPILSHAAFDTAAMSAFSAYPSTAQSLPGGMAKVNFQTEVYDHLNEFDTATSRFTAAAGGLYLFSAAAGWDSGGTDGMQATLLFYKNGSAFKRLTMPIMGGAGSGAIGGTCNMKLAANDYVEVYISMPAITLSNNPINTYFSGVRVA